MSLAREVLNFYAGPAALPGSVVERIRGDLGNFGG
jgi:phosphoserine aminotransferase